MYVGYLYVGLWVFILFILKMKRGSMYRVPNDFMNYSIDKILVLCFISHASIWFDGAGLVLL